MNQIVKYDNYMNNLSLGSFKGNELNMLFAICSKMRDKGTETLEFTFAEIRQIANLKGIDSHERFDAALNSMNSKLNHVVGHFETEEECVYFSLFPTLRTRKKEGIVRISVNPEFSFVLNELTSNFTVFELEEFCDLKSKYSKNLYRLLKQYDNENSGWRRFESNDLRIKLGCPESYPNKRFVAEILNPAVDELSAIFHNLTLDITKAKRKGSPISGYEFRWKPCVNDEMPGQTKLSFIDENGDKQFRTVPKINKKIHNYEERTYSSEYYRELENENH